MCRSSRVSDRVLDVGVDDNVRLPYALNGHGRKNEISSMTICNT